MFPALGHKDLAALGPGLDALLVVPTCMYQHRGEGLEVKPNFGPHCLSGRQHSNALEVVEAGKKLFEHPICKPVSTCVSQINHSLATQDGNMREEQCSTLTRVNQNARQVDNL